MVRSEIGWVEFDPPIGSEIRKTRPAVIVGNDAANRHMTRVPVISLSSNIELVYPGETVVTLAGQKSMAMADQLMTADKKRLKNRFGSLSQADIRAVDTMMKIQLGIEA